MLNPVENTFGYKIKNLSPKVKQILALKGLPMFTQTKQAVTIHDKEIPSKSLFWVSFITRNIHSSLKKNYITFMIIKN